MKNVLRIAAGIFLSLIFFILLFSFFISEINNPFIGITLTFVNGFISFKISFKLINRLFNYNAFKSNELKSEKMKLFLICLFTGLFGGHYFAIGKFKRGFLYFFTGGLFGIGWFYDLVKMLVKDDFRESVKEKKQIERSDNFDTLFVQPSDSHQQQYNKSIIKSPKYTNKFYDEFIVLDFETTGLYPTVDKIIEVSAIKYKDGILIDEFHTLINPKIEIPAKITKINGITNSMVKDKPTIEEILPKLLQFIGPLPIVAHNASFDARFLKYAVLYHFGEDIINNQFIDTLTIAREIYPRLINYKLETIKKYLQFDLQSHRAYDDTLVTAQIYLDYCNKKKEEYMSQIPTYDPIDEDIYKCFIAHKSGMNEKIGTWEDFYKIEEKIAEICNEHGGRYYKSSSKNAKFAIIFNYVNRTKSCVETLRNKGYKVTTFEEALKFFGLENMWNIESIQKAEKEHKEYIYGMVE